jgi:hypothetical protein
LRKQRLGLIHAPGKHPLQLKSITLRYPELLKEFAGPSSSYPFVPAFQIRLRLFGSSGGTWKGKGRNESMRGIAGATHHPQDLDLLQVTVLPVRGVSFQTVQGAAGRTEPYTKMPCPLINKEVKVVVFFLDIDYDNATW